MPYAVGTLNCRLYKEGTIIIGEHMLEIKICEMEVFLEERVLQSNGRRKFEIMEENLGISKKT
jgi:hypothetical protein